MTIQAVSKSIALEYVKTIGITNNQPIGRGFAFPYDTAISSDGRIYVLNVSRSNAGQGQRIQVCNLDEDWFGEFGKGRGPGDDQFGQPVCVAFDSRDQLYVTDDHLGEIKVFSKEGQPVRRWGSKGSAAGELDGGAGIAVDGEDNLYVVDQRNNRVQKFTPDGELLLAWGEAGSGAGQFSLPWGLGLDSQGNVYVADWRNDRIQKFTADGEFLLVIGESGGGDGQLSRPSGVAVDSEGFVYVADWGNERVQVFGPEGDFRLKLLGQATVSKWAQEWLDANVDELEARNRSQLLVERLPEHLESAYHTASQVEPYFWGPVSVRLDKEDRLYVTEHSRHRIQVYQKA